MDQDAIVTSVEGEHAFIEVGGAANCGRCHEAGGCQTSILGMLFSGKPRQFRIANRIGAVPGDHVLVRVAEGAALRATLLAYVLPVACLLLGAAVGTALDGGSAYIDLSAALGALAGFGSGILVTLTLRKSSICRIAEPVLISRSSSFCFSKEACR